MECHTTCTNTFQNTFNTSDKSKYIIACLFWHAWCFKYLTETEMATKRVGLALQYTAKADEVSTICSKSQPCSRVEYQCYLINVDINNTSLIYVVCRMYISCCKYKDKKPSASLSSSEQNQRTYFSVDSNTTCKYQYFLFSVT